MNRTQKQETVKTFTEKVKNAKAFILADYLGLTVAQMTSLRRKLDKDKSSMRVVKNRLFKRALKDLSIEGLDTFLKGTVAMVYSNDDPILPAKVLAHFAKDNEKLKIKAGFMDNKVMTAKMLHEIASLPSREILLAKLLGTMNAPATNIVGVIAAVPRQLVTALNAIKEKKQ
ncbi:MAG: 50S ribosomal protein L10 [Deltaproteobacteria bacterium CG11_big_fil_rev_8_21_14_0_20_49_13]|nr:MAG: 50S ribosomal protein L10 [Deltaproteobacteria bacterium CG11_big_fil_rev_8_21_14_0_20_49_13]